MQWTMWQKRERFKYSRRYQKNLLEPFQYRLEEHNSLLLDMAQYAFDEEEWQEREELLRIDNLFREKLHYPLRMEGVARALD